MWCQPLSHTGSAPGSESCAEAGATASDAACKVVEAPGAPQPSTAPEPEERSHFTQALTVKAAPPAGSAVASALPLAGVDEK
jgi:hypothetical protein